MDWLDSVSGVHQRPKGIVDDARRRLMRLGPQALTDAELVSVLIGLTDPPALAALLQHGLRAIVSSHPEALVEHHGLDRHTAARLLAAGELARRLPHAAEERPRLQTPQAIYEWARARLCGLRREEFHVLCLNSRNVLLRSVRVAEGSVDQCNVDPREALAPAIACRATGIVLIHNHPSGDPEPSVNDVALTRQLRDGAKLLCIRVLDHLVLGERSYVSMLARGLLREDTSTFLTRLDEPNNR
ncbi:MAG: DNA repair protein RadC [Myxococcales bacterium]|nr:DNA repair protein RadC [Myxococcales bacterium]